MPSSPAPAEPPAAPDSRAVPDEHDARHRAHCGLCTNPNADAAEVEKIVNAPSQADAFVAAVVAAHAPDARPVAAPSRLAPLVSGDGSLRPAVARRARRSKVPS